MGYHRTKGADLVPGHLSCGNDAMAGIGLGIIKDAFLGSAAIEKSNHALC